MPVQLSRQSIRLLTEVSGVRVPQQAPLGNKTNTQNGVRFVLSPVEASRSVEPIAKTNTLSRDVRFFISKNYFGIKIRHTPPFSHTELLKTYQEYLYISQLLYSIKNNLSNNVNKNIDKENTIVLQLYHKRSFLWKRN